MFAVPSALRAGRARCIGSRCCAPAPSKTSYVVAPGRVGEHCPRRRSYGHSMAIEPFGAVVARVVDEPGICVAEVDPDRLERLRAQLPVHDHDRLDSCHGVQRR